MRRVHRAGLLVRAALLPELHLRLHVYEHRHLCALSACTGPSTVLWQAMQVLLWRAQQAIDEAKESKLVPEGALVEARERRERVYKEEQARIVVEEAEKLAREEKDSGRELTRVLPCGVLLSKHSFE